MTRPRVLIVDDSAFVRTVLARVLKGTGEIDVVGTARDGDDALEQIAAHDPDVVTLDLNMPNRDGLEVLRELHGRARPRVIIVSVSTIDSSQAVEALALGAIDLVTKPSALATDRLYEISSELTAKILAVAPRAPAKPSDVVAAKPASSHGDLVMIGTSTGGPQALTRVLAALPGNLDAAVAMVLHIPVGFTEALARRLDNGSELEVLEAYDGVQLIPGRAVLARAGMHLRVERVDDHYIGRLDPLPLQPHVPSVNELFLSGARAAGNRAIGVVLTGMGEDGLSGAREIAAAGGSLVTESASTSVVYGMPRVVYEAGLGATAKPIDQVAQEIVGRVRAR
jgi:two-component system chemotaxis response regulator CheB